ncbi:DUF1573 domain-containing protein [Halosquirtibacter laminarini]|uniref:DUF1573 domain-containing protein n=1 Tax=Halosquirtibacter laminarini TaxID=3374600 RepID=A0AC61NIL6_9BACT|nr:DUF1573 domain-containing protein [Prolixibacteraceae bacterium]
MIKLKKQDVDYKDKRLNRYNNKAIIIMVALFCFYGCLNTSPKQSKEQIKKDKSETPSLRFKKRIHNFGKLKDGEKVYTSFFFTNEGGKPITITKYTKSCGCITIEGPNKPILPGKESRVVVTFDTSGEWGKQMKTFGVITSNHHSYNLTITAVVENELFQNVTN